MTTVFIISAPSGSGKSTLVHRLLAEVENLAFSVSYTTRRPRGNEVDGEAYHFIDRAEFERRIASDEFLEHAELFGSDLYGTHVSALEKARKRGQDLVLDIDVQGAAQLKKRLPDAVSIFVLPPSREILEQRLRARGQDAEMVIQRRLADAAQEISRYRRYDYVLVNKDLNIAVETLKGIVRAERVRRQRVEEKIQPILDSFGQALKV